MSYWGSRGVSVDSFDGYDTTAYSGGYDLSLTYGRQLQPSDEICFPISAAGDVDFERPHYSSGSQTSAFETDRAKKSDCYGRSGFQLQPEPLSNRGYPAYGHQSYGHGGCGAASDYGSKYAGRPQYQEYGSTYGQGYGQRPQHQEFRSEYESGSKPQHESGYGREGSKHYGDEGYDESGYRRCEEEGYGRQGHGGNEYRGSQEEVGGYGGYMKNNDYAYGGNTSYVKPSYGVSVEESDMFRTSGYGKDGSGGYTNSSYGDEYQSTGYRKPSYYGGEEGEGYGHSNYGNDSDDVEKKHSHHKHHHRHH